MSNSHIRQQMVNAIVFSVCIGLPIAGWLYFERHVATWLPTLADRALYGEQFGGLNTLFAGLAAGGVIFTLFLSYQQLRLQHREFERTASTLQASQTALAEQTRLLSEQIAEAVPRTHRVVAAEDRVDFAQLMLTKVESSLDEAVMWMPEEKRKKVTEALAESKAAWDEHVSATIGFSAAASPAPEGSTSALASAISIQARMKEERAKQLAEWTEWIQVNFRP
jgi:hypothetical protein